MSKNNPKKKSQENIYKKNFKTKSVEESIEDKLEKRKFFKEQEMKLKQSKF